MLDGDAAPGMCGNTTPVIVTALVIGAGLLVIAA